jgi:hypothetical protein
MTMNDEQLPPTEPAADQPPVDQGATPEAHPASSQAREWLAQLQQMIDQVAAHAAPVARDVAAKAAELAAVAGDKAGPFAKRAAEKTEAVGARVADRSRRFAEEIRNRADTGEPAESAGAAETPSEAAGPPDDETAGA